MFESPYGNNLSSLNLSNKRINYFIIFSYCLYFTFLFLFSFFFSFFYACNFAHDILIGIFAMPMVSPPIFYLYRPFGFSI